MHMAKELKQVILKNNAGIEVQLLNFGARVSSIKIPVNGQATEMTVNHEQTDNYLNDNFYLGATCGPVCNRIGGAKFFIGEQAFELSANNGENCLHGGEYNLSYVYWQLEQHSLTTTYAKFSYHSPDLEFGFPGNKTFTVEYQIDDELGLNIDFQVETDKNTLVNLTNHVYFHLGEHSCLPLQVKINSDKFLERTSSGIPTGELLPTSDLGTDIKSRQLISELLTTCDYQQIIDEQGIDHWFIINKSANNLDVASLYNEKLGIKLQVSTNQPSVQMYTGAFLSEPFNRYHGVCLEAQGYVNAPNHSHFPSILVSAKKPYQKHIRYQFSVEG